MVSKFSGAKDLDEIPTGSPPMGAPNRDGVGYNSVFRPIFRNILETVQDKDIVKVER